MLYIYMLYIYMLYIYVIYIYMLYIYVIYICYIYIYIYIYVIYIYVIYIYICYVLMTNHDGSSSLMTLGYLDFPPKLGPRIPPFEFVGPSFGYAFINPPYLPARSGKSRSSWHIMAPGYKLPCP